LVGLVEDMIIIDQPTTKLLQLLTQRTDVIMREIIIDWAELLHQHFYMGVVGRDDPMVVVAHFAELLHISKCLSGIVQRLGMHLSLRVQPWKSQIKD